MGGKDTGAHGSITHFCPSVECNGQDPQHFCSKQNTVRDTTFLEEAGIFSYRTIGREEGSLDSGTPEQSNLSSKKPTG